VSALHHVRAWTDGASRGNPGESGAGAILRADDDAVVAEVSVYLGIGTNNRAEYEAVRAALVRALELNVREVDVYMDSELVQRQMTGVYRIKDAGLKPLATAVQALAARFDRCAFHHVRRAQNADADRLANEAIDNAVHSRRV
jgi:ribonuclease HI